MKGVNNFRSQCEHRYRGAVNNLKVYLRVKGTNPKFTKIKSDLEFNILVSFSDQILRNSYNRIAPMPETITLDLGYDDGFMSELKI